MTFKILEASEEKNRDPMKTSVSGHRRAPILGVFTAPSAVEGARSQRASVRMNYLAKANKRAGTTLYFFSIKDLHPGEDRINGVFYNYTTKRWEQKFFPLPEVLYDRLGELPEESKELGKAIRDNGAIKKINPIYLFDKWEIYKGLMSFKDMRPHLPFTIMYSNIGDLLGMFERYDTLYIKDTMGHRGLGVARVIRNSDGVFELSYFNEKLYTNHFYSLGRLASKMDTLFQDKKIIIQCAIDTLKLQECNIDMRATLQRGRSGKLKIIAYPVRVGRRGSPITSTSSGSQVYPFEEFFRTKLNYSKAQLEGLRVKIDRFLIKTYRHLEELYGFFGEIGIDFALDKAGRLWFIECNAKPGKDTILMSYGEDVVDKVFLNPLEYAKYLCDIK